MFSGIVETTSHVVDVTENQGILRIKVEKPHDFNDIEIGDSVACNGVCLTVEEFTESALQFAVAAETLQVTHWNAEFLKSRPLNLERSLRFGDRVHGHLVTGHVDEMGQVTRFEQVSGGWMLDVSCSFQLSPMVWKKGSIAINGVSLTVNSFEDQSISVCLIPETINRTNLNQLKVGDKVCLEADNMARGMVHLMQSQEIQ
ncbi:MAG: riboflavin synthase [Bdellovibrionales bacterium]